jgi:periplasmic protein TonB
MSALGNLSQCMVDSDAEAIARARWLRRKAILISICIEAVCLAAMLIWPLITPGVLAPLYILTPLPPYHGGGAPNALQRRPRTNLGQTIMRDRFRYPLTQPSNPARPVADESAPEIGPNSGGNSGLDPGSAGLGPIIPGGGDNGLRLEPPRETAAAKAPVRQKVSEGVMAGALIHRVDPVYPTIARAMHLSGTVRLRAIIATDGSVQHLEVLSGSSILARAAEAAVREWRYHPTLLSGVPVEVETYITVNFVLGE